VSGAFIDYYDFGDHKVSGAIWCDGPKAGTKWVTPAGGGKQILVKRATAKQKHPGQWVEVRP